MKLLIFALLLVLMSACATKQTGFFNSYEGMKEVDKNFYFRKVDSANLTAYKKLFIPEVKLMTTINELTPEQRKLNLEIKAYATRAYRENIRKNSSNYQLVDMRQKNTLEMQIALSLAYIEKDAKGLEALHFMPLLSDKTSQKVHLVIEVETVDIMSSKVLARSLRIIKDEDIDIHTLSFKTLQASLDTWLSKVAKY